MEDSLLKYFSRLEQLAVQTAPESLYLWPHRPVQGDLQDEILAKVGVSDYDLENPTSRPARIIAHLRSLRESGGIPADFTALDIACGDAIVLWQLRKAFPEAQCQGVDCKVDACKTHSSIRADGVGLSAAYIQHLFACDPPRRFDIVLMLNTYRGWENVELHGENRKLPRLADAWFERNARYWVLSAKDSQVRRLARHGLGVVSLGRAEQPATQLICLSKSTTPRPVWRRVWSRIADVF